VAELPSPGKGKVHKINYKPDEACLVGNSLCEIELEDEVSQTNAKSSKHGSSSATSSSHKETLSTEKLSELGIQDILKAEEQLRLSPEQQDKERRHQKSKSRFISNKNKNLVRNNKYILNKVLATPAVRFLMKQHNLKPEDIEGTGKDGRVTKEDVLNYVDQLKNIHVRTPSVESQHKHHKQHHQNLNHHRQEEKISLQGKQN